MEKVTAQQVLDLKLPDNDAGAATVRHYLGKLLSEMWRHGEDFVKRPFGNSGWQYDLYAPMVRAGFVEGALDEDGNVEEHDENAADELIQSAIASALGAPVRVELAPGEVMPDYGVEAVRDVGRRVSHSDLMVAADRLSRAREKEQDAGHLSRAREINQLALGCFQAAIRVEGLDFEGAPS